jgi:chitin disaccharide deacetylase
MLLLSRLFSYAVMLALFPAACPSRAEAPSLAQRLGYTASDKLLIVNADDTGMCHSANTAVIEALGQGLLRSATIMVPCPWFPEIAAYAKANPDKDFGIHLCHTSEWGKYRWGPVAPRDQVPGLLDPDGYLWRDVPEVYTNGTPAQALIEGRAQIRRALAAGIDVTHLDSHMGTLQLHPDYLKVYLQLAVEFNLPVRMASQETLNRAGFPELRAAFAAKGIVFPDHFVYEELKDESKDVKGFWMKIVANLKPGVTELYIHPAVVSDELKAITGTWQTRSLEYEIFTHDAAMRQLIQDAGVRTISFRPLRNLQREMKKPPGTF